MGELCEGGVWGSSLEMMTPMSFGDMGEELGESAYFSMSVCHLHPNNHPSKPISVFPETSGTNPLPPGKIEERGANHKTKIPPLIQEIPVHINTIWLAQILGYEGADRGKVLLLVGVRVLDVQEFRGKGAAFFSCVA